MPVRREGPNVVAGVVVRHLLGLSAQLTLGCNHCRDGAAVHLCGVPRMGRDGPFLLARQTVQGALGHDQRTAGYDRRQGAETFVGVELGEAAFETALEVACALLGRSGRISSVLPDACWSSRSPCLASQ